ncbi:MAG: arginine repressor [Actinomycetota bacterium]
MSGKQQRQQAITKLIAADKVTSQPQLQDLLAKRGIEATQATISRDLEELGAVKVRVAGGESRYAIPDYEPERVAPSDQLRRVLGEWVAEVSVSGNLVVLRTPPGCAHVVASALDRSGDPSLIGTVAGDDTILCVAAESTGGRSLAASLRELAGLAPSSVNAPGRAASRASGARTPARARTSPAPRKKAGSRGR